MNQKSIPKYIYPDLINKYGKEFVFEALVYHGLFHDRLPPCFTSESLLKLKATYLLAKKKEFQKKRDYVTYKKLGHNYAYREMAIPHPFAYYELCSVIREMWEETINKAPESFESYKSLIHVKKIKNKKHIFEMNYDGEDEYKKHIFEMNDHSEDGKQSSIINKYILQDNRYEVKVDISSFFPSIYSHSIPWAIVGKKEAKEKQKDKTKFFNCLDQAIRNTSNGETNGILIGPHTSSIISELILNKIDEDYLKDFKYTRAIDDYTFFCKTETEINKFLNKLKEGLSYFKLKLNDKKTKIRKLPFVDESYWALELKNFNLKDHSFSLIEHFVNFTIKLFKEYDDIAILNYGLKKLKKSFNNKKNCEFIFYQYKNLACLYPYLAFILDEYLFEPIKKTLLQEEAKKNIKGLSESLLKVGLEKEYYDVIAFVLFFAIKHDFKFKSIKESEESIINSLDCVLYILYYYYNKTNGERNEGFIEKAKEKIKEEEIKDSHWLFLYQLYYEEENISDVFKEGKNDKSFEIMKDKHINFIKEDFYKKVTTKK